MSPDFVGDMITCPLGFFGVPVLSHQPSAALPNKNSLVLEPSLEKTEETSTKFKACHPPLVQTAFKLFES